MAGKPGPLIGHKSPAREENIHEHGPLLYPSCNLPPLRVFRRGMCVAP